MKHIARRYALALFQLSQERGDSSQVAQDLQQLKEFLKTDPALAAFLKNKLVHHADIQQVLHLLGTAFQFSETTQGFLALLLRNKRLRWLAVISDIFQDFYDNAHGIIRGEIISARSLPSGIKNTFENMLSQKLKKKVFCTERQDKALLGGMIVNVGSYMIDASVKTQLRKIHDLLKGQK
jgi:F-type H+-transporting ATPase subunit delta